MKREPPSGAEVRRQIQTRLVDALLGAQLVREESGRQLLLDELRERLGELPMRTHTVLRLTVAEIVRVCAVRSDGVAELVVTVEHLEPGTAELMQLHRLRDEWEAVDLLQPSDWTVLRPVLEQTSPKTLGLLCQQATGHRVAGPPVWCGNAWDVFVHLAGTNAEADGVPPNVLFLELLAREVGDDIAQHIHRRNREQAREYELTAALAQRRAAAEAEEISAATAYLVVQIEPDLDPRPDEEDSPERYWVSHHRQWRGPEVWHSRLGPRRLVDADGLEGTIENIIDQMETEWSDRPGTVAVEFVLPWELLNAEVEWWRKETSSARPTVLAMDYPIVVRSLERLRTQRWHRYWHQRWDQLRRAPASSVVQVSTPSGKDYLTRLDIDLRSDERIVSLVLSEPPIHPGSPGQQEVEAAMRAGLPVVIWHRSDCTSSAFREAVDRLTADGGLADLPQRTKQLRLDALRQEPELRDEHIGRHVTILWDDPERKPEPLSSPSTPRTEELHR